MNAQSKAIADLIFVAARTPADGVRAARRNPAGDDEDPGMFSVESVVSDLAVLIGKKEAERLRGVNIGSVAMMGTAELRNLGLSAPAASKLRAAFKLAIKAANDAALPSVSITTPDKVAELMRDRVALLPHEECWALFLTAAKKLKGDLFITKGGFESAAVEPRVVFGGALEVRAHSLILVHNHPSGDSTPSSADRTLSNRFKEIGQTVGVLLVDHVIIVRGGFASLAMQGLI